MNQYYHKATNLDRAAREDPPSLNAIAASSFLAVTTSRTTLPSSPSINCLTRFSTSIAVTIPPSDSSIGSASFMSCVNTTLFNFCSAYSGHATNGTPAQTASKMEFHPQCVTNPPTDLWLRTATCGAQFFTTSPLFFVRSTKPSGSSTSKSGSGGGRNRSSFLFEGGLLTTQRNRTPLISNPFAISFNCSFANAPKLPKHKYTTLPLGCKSSQFKHSCEPSPPLATNGPTQ
ncbi:hypothetical protein HanHA300_Chr09g0315521 [Helianthus annuus]|nr:hypothetical protein HanHA300_Chr09g0315521 [Helianthus annuus]KAJ0542129.1 hypothetical protein HanHA89_Chr09g0336421 [Helianthus annuus]KAJ0707188.1 hypothetical protein HanLR1_Chr09g0315731 [Helianthus annuus]KAJ0711210.1 hypothetical protein HanOQP8_Chr09g0321321 [Helianthus annuus]